MYRVTGGSHPALEHLNTVDNKKCKYAMHIGVLKEILRLVVSL